MDHAEGSGGNFEPLPPDPYIEGEDEESEEEVTVERLQAYVLVTPFLRPLPPNLGVTRAYCTYSWYADLFIDFCSHISANKAGGYYDDHAATIRSLVKEKRKRRAGTDPPEARRMHGEALELYADGRLDEALTKLQGTIVDHPGMAAAYKSLGLVHETMKNWHEAAVNYEIAGDKLKEPSVLVQAAHLYKRIGDVEKAFACFGRAAKFGSVDLETFTQRASMLLQDNQPKKALQELLNARKVPAHAHNIPLLKEIARIYQHHLGDLPNAVLTLADAYSYMVEEIDNAGARRSNPNIHFDMDLATAYAEALAHMQEWGRVPPVIDYADLKRGMHLLPIELQFFSAIANIHLKGLESSQAQLHYLLEQDPNQWGPQFMDLIDTLMVKEKWDEALNFLNHLRKNPEYESPVVWSKIAQCHHKLERFAKAIEYYEMSFQHDKSNVEACLSLSQTYHEAGEPERAIQVVEEYQRATGERLPEHGMAEARAPRDGASMDVEEAHPQALISASERYAQREAQLKVMLRKADLFFAQGEYDQYVDIMTEFFGDENIRFTRKKRRHVAARPDMEETVAAAGKRKGRKTKAAQTPLDTLGAGITAATAQGQAFDEYADFDEEPDDDELDENDEPVPKSSAARAGTAAAGSNPKKRKHSEVEVQYGGVRERRAPTGELLESNVVDVGLEPSLARRTEMSSRHNMWELRGMTDFCKTLINYCKCLLYTNRATPLTFRLVDMAYAMIFQELSFINEPSELRCDVRYRVAQIAYAVGRPHVAAKYMRQPLQAFPERMPLWNFFFKTVSQTRNFYVNRGFATRMIEKHPASLPIQLLNGHMSLISSSYQYAVTHYLKAYLQESNVSITLLCTAVAYVNRSMSRSNPNRHGSIMKAFAYFFQYFVEQKYISRYGAHEAHYNLARAFHHVSLYQYAVPLYQDVLKDPYPPSMRLYGEEKEQYVATLQREAAYNLALIYRASGAHQLARQLLMDYLTF